MPPRLTSSTSQTSAAAGSASRPPTQACTVAMPWVTIRLDFTTCRAWVRIGGLGAQQVAKCSRTDRTTSTSYWPPRFTSGGTRWSVAIRDCSFSISARALPPLKNLRVVAISGKRASRVGGAALAASTQYTFSGRTSAVSVKWGNNQAIRRSASSISSGTNLSIDEAWNKSALRYSDSMLVCGRPEYRDKCFFARPSPAAAR